ncbi:3-isopropylmalate/(R)-2-methylmalate dehydratase small subunit [Desulfofundulus luciae]|uniref:3-isopropylmalate dehydratase small subunit n=1 Tax=Desulfofundulus luciae TaxID=74702 RepID=A0ABU0AY21_9FIRM|nr:3-isopropylmalate dehydratase small subunit [Desulfofundulus luciae]MDQ0285380.1 3-isopropylmalate/(R)-2-methylmalate dehydratase small subunit [Desulfofundulus luciae]
MTGYVIRGRVHKYGDNINTDIISPAQYMELSYADMAAHAMEGIDPDFSRKVRPGDIVVAGKNFGSGSSRETAPIALKYAGVGAVVAKFFARIFYRNALNIGLPVLELPEVGEINDGDELEIDLARGTIRNLTRNKDYRFTALPDHILELLQAGGLVPLLEQKMQTKY